MTSEWNRVVAAVVALFFGAALACAADNDTCPEGGDYLAKWQKKPAHVEFVECRYHDDGGEAQYWAAKYRVPGMYAVQVENHLVRSFHMKRLKKFCCAWDTPDSVGYVRKGEHFTVAMTSDEDGPFTASTATRADWRKLPFFYVSVQHYKTE